MRALDISAEQVRNGLPKLGFLIGHLRLLPHVGGEGESTAMTQRILVIGAGVIGASVAYHLAKAGAAPLVVEAGDVGSGTSSGSFAWLNAHDKQPRDYHDLIMRGNRAHRALGEEIGNPTWLHLSGCLEWWPSDPDRAESQRQRVARLLGWGHQVDWLTAADLLALEPDIDPAAVAEADIVFYPTDGSVDTDAFTHVLIREACRHGAEVRVGQAVQGLTTTGSRVTGVELASGERIEADHVVNCMGRWANRFAETVGFAVPLEWRPGLCAITHPIPANLNRVIKAPGCYIKPDGGGRLRLHAKSTDRALGPIDMPDCGVQQSGELVRLAAQVIPSAQDAEIASVRVVVRPYPVDGKPSVGAVPGIDGYYLAVTHSGVSLSPLVGRAVADELVRNRLSTDFAAYRPERFTA